MTKTNGIQLKEVYKDYFKIGTAGERINERFTSHEIGNPDKEELILEQFSSFTCANELKPAYNMGFASPEAKEDYLPFVINKAAKEMLDWAKAGGIKVRGHVLVWHSQCAKEAFCKEYKPVTIPTDPEKLKENPMLKRFEKLDPVCFVDRATMLKRLQSYVYSAMEYMYANDYAKTIYAWDVVNEAIELQDKTPTGLRNSYWYQVIGDDFIYWSFKYTKEAVDELSRKYANAYGVNPDDEEALKSIQPILFYNDYNEFQPDKKAAIIEMLNREGHGHGSILGEKLITGIGMQGHISDNNDIEEYEKALYDYGKLGLEVHITELDVKCTCSNINREYYQALFYKQFFEMLIKAKENGVNLTAVVFWGLTDDNSWIRGADPLLFRGDLSPKKVFDALVYAAKGGDLGEPEVVEIDLSDRYYDFESVDENEVNSAEAGNTDADKPYYEKLGFKARGFAKIDITDKDAHSGKYCLFNEFRGGDWCGVEYDVSDFIGQTVEISAWVKSSALAVELKAAEGVVVGSADTTSGEWVELKTTTKIPSELHSMTIFFGTKEANKESMSPLYIDDVSIKLVGLFESFEEEKNIAAIRGAGHLPFLCVTDEESVDGKSHSLKVTRQEKDATVKFNVSSYVGNKIMFSAFVKTSDKVVKMGLDGAVSTEISSIEVKEGWNKIEGVVDLPKALTTAEIYIETDGNAEFYVDEIAVTRTEG